MIKIKQIIASSIFVILLGVIACLVIINTFEDKEIDIAASNSISKLVAKN